MLRRPTALLTLALLVTACTGLSGVPYRIQTMSPSGITILTDPALRNLSQVQSVARAHCAQYGKTAVQTGVGKLRGGQAPVSFTCRA